MGVFNIDGIKVKNPDYKTSFSMFEKFGVIGDSFASGQVFINGSLANHYNISWPSVLSRITGTEVYNFSTGGLTTKTWLTNTAHGLEALNAAPAADLYIIALGINDSNISLPIGTINDIESDETDSFYSYYGRIIRAIREHSPKAVIILTTLARWTTNYNSYSAAIKRIGTYYSFPVLDLSNNVFFQSDFFTNNQVSGHPTAPVYSAMAEEFKYLIEQETENNTSRYYTYTGA